MEKVLAGVPRSLLEHRLAPLRAQAIDRALLEPSCGCSVLEHVRVERLDRRRVDELGALARLEPVGGERDVREHRASRLQHACAFGEAALRVDVDEHVATPDPVDGRIGERQRLDRSLDHLDRVVETGLLDRGASELDVDRDRVERDGTQAVVAHEPDRIPGVTRPCVEDELSCLGAELCERCEQPVDAARLEAAAERFVELCLVGPELVELLDRRHQPPAIAGSRITVEPSCTSVSSPSSVRTSSPST